MQVYKNFVMQKRKLLISGRQIVFLRVRFSEKEFYMTGLIIFPANNMAWVCFSLMKNTNG